MPPVTDPRVDACIERAAPFARPILTELLAELRARVHRARPEVEETIKWGMPSLTRRGRILCTMTAFKQHATFGFWHGDRVVGGRHAAASRADDTAAMGQFGRLTAPADLPGKREMAGGVRAARFCPEGRAAGARRPRRRAARQPEGAGDVRGIRVEPPARVRPRREYVQWIVEARRDDTRQRRIAQAVEWLADGKPRHWKYRKR